MILIMDWIKSVPILKYETENNGRSAKQPHLFKTRE